MQTNDKKILGSLALSTVALTTLSLGQAMPATAADWAEIDTCFDVPTHTEAVEASASDDAQSVRNIQGIFTWDQNAVSDNAVLKRAIYDSASKYVCAAHESLANLNGEIEAAQAQSGEIAAIRISGDVRHPSMRTIEDNLEEAPITTVLGCTCAGNPADGRASANASVTGFALKTLIDKAEPANEANAITFISQDGYEVSLPLSYVMQRHSIIVTEVNGAAIDETLGCQNQLWLGATAARAFVQDVVEIRITSEEVAPAAPGTEGYNQPNIGILNSEVTA